MSAIVKAVLFAVELGGTMIGNVFLLVLLWKSRQVHRSGSMNFIFNCATADLANGMINIPLAMDYLIFKTENLKGTVATVAIRSVFSFMVMITFNSAIMVMVDRLLIVKYPVKYNNMMTVKRARFAVIVMWIATVLLAVIFSALRFSRNLPTEHDGVFGYMRRSYRSGDNFRFILMAILASAILLTVGGLTGMLYRELQKLHTKKVTKGSPGRRMIDSSSRTALIVMTMYMVSFFPALGVAALKIFGIIQGNDTNVVGFAAIFFTQMTSLLNPYVFILRSSTLKQAAAKMINNR